MAKSEYIKKIIQLERKLEDRVTHIEAREYLPQFGAESFRKFQNRLENKLRGKDLSSLTEEELRTVYRDIAYIGNLKSTTVAGAYKAQRMYLPIQEKLQALSPDVRRRFWAIYSKIIETNALMEQFKYELMEQNIDYLYSGQIDEDFIVNKIYELYDEIVEQVGSGYGDEEDEKDVDKKIARLFTSKLDSIFK